MRYLNKKALIPYALIILFLISKSFLLKIISVSKFTNIVNPLFWIFIAILSYLLSKDESNIKMRAKYDIIQSIIIIMIVYSMIYFTLGLFFGYEKSPYLHNLTIILKNFWCFLIPIIFQEISRFQIIKLSPKKIMYYALTTLLFIIVEIDFVNISSNIGTNVDFFKYMSQTIIPLIVSNCLFTYLAITSGSITSTIYRGILMLLTLLLPIYPSINWLIKSMMDIILVIIIALYVNYVDIKSSRVLTRRQLKKESVLSYMPFVVILIVLVCFISGSFKYQPIAVLSDSMVPEFSRGDAVIIKKIDKKDLKKLKKGIILYYSKEGKPIIHRIVSVKIDGNDVEITTKGDNNNTEDPWTVKSNEIIGVAKFMVPFIGYPSVLISEFLK
ncbi:MAG: signal peptidase I [bacterium]|nr:signal peptidase I [bacterium]